MYATRCVTALILVIGACRPVDTDRAALEAAVYAAVLDSLFAGDSTRVHVIAREHADPLQFLSRDPDMNLLPRSRKAALDGLQRRAVSPDFAEDFVAANSRLDTIRLPIRARLPVVFDTLPPATPAEEEAALHDLRDQHDFRAGFERVAHAYPGARWVVRFSRVGLSRGRDRALLYVDYYCGALCAGVDLVTLRWDDGRWQIVGYDVLGVS